MVVPATESDASENGASGGKRRLRWSQLSAVVRSEIEQLAGGQVISAANCTDGFSPGLASLLTLADDRLIFVKTIDGDAWPGQVAAYRDEARVAAALPATVPAPRFIGSADDGHWVILAFEGIADAEPVRLDQAADVQRVAAAIGRFSCAADPSPITMPSDQPRLGGWAGLGDGGRLERLADYAAESERERTARAAVWACDRLPLLVALEAEGLVAAQGEALVHFDAFPHNILLTPQRVLLVDWPHARLGAAFIDLVSFLSCAAGAAGAAGAGVDPEPILAENPAVAGVPGRAIDGVLAALAGFALCHCPDQVPAGLGPLFEAKVSIGLGAIEWLARRQGWQL